MMANERTGLRGVAGTALNPKARIARYREQAIFFARLAKGERDARFRKYWENLAREYDVLRQRVGAPAGVQPLRAQGRD
jgi:hypothetical protein